jgi:hypothetical protein
LSGQPDDSAAFGDDRLRIGPRLRRFPFYVTSHVRLQLGSAESLIEAGNEVQPMPGSGMFV